MNDQCTDVFMEAFDSGCGGCVRECVCGITHFDGSPDGQWSWEPGELEGLRHRRYTNPGKCVEQDHTIGTIEINGCAIVIGCTCDTARKYENFLRHNATQIKKYLNGIAAELRSQADAIEVKT